MICSTSSSSTSSPTLPTCPSVDPTREPGRIANSLLGSPFHSSTILDPSNGGMWGAAGTASQPESSGTSGWLQIMCSWTAAPAPHLAWTGWFYSRSISNRDTGPGAADVGPGIRVRLRAHRSGMPQRWHGQVRCTLRMTISRYRGSVGSLADPN